MTFDQLISGRTWKPIPHCPGRFVLSTPTPDLTPRDLVGPDVVLRECQVETARDIVVVGDLLDGGLISYKRVNGTYVHTLNTPEGFERKLLQLGLGAINASSATRR